MVQIQIAAIVKGELLNEFGYLVDELETALVIIFREQSH